MSRLVAARSSLALAIFATACGDVHLIGRECLAGGCPTENVHLSECGVRLTLPSVEVASGAEIDRCQLFTLDALVPAAATGHVYLSRSEARMMPAGHHLDVRIAPEVPDFPDGPIDCMELWSRTIAWVPLMATQGENDTWDFTDAPLVTTRNHRLLIDDHFANLSAQPVLLDVALDVSCVSKVPANVSQAFEFSDRTSHVVLPGRTEVAGANCPFEEDVLVSRLYRWTNLVTSFSVWRLKETEPLWRSDSDWILDIDPALPFMMDEGFRWQCVYDNTSDQVFEVGGNSSDTCSLLGIYRLASGGEDEAPERCTR